MRIISETRLRGYLLAQLLFTCIFVHVVVSEWDGAYEVWTNNLLQCQDEESPYMPPISFSSQESSPAQAVIDWSSGVRDWLDALNLTGPCLPINGSEEIDRLRSLLDAAETNSSIAAENIVTATYDAYCLWAQILFKSGQGHLVVIPGYSDDSTLLQDLEDAQTVMRNAFHLWKNNKNCNEVNIAQCEQELDNSTLTTDDRDISIICSNTVTEGSEECDDGNHVNDDGCSSTCKLETCPLSTASPTVMPSPTPILPDLSSSFCPNDCNSTTSPKRGTVHLSNFALKGNEATVDTDTIKELRNGLALLAQVMTILSRSDPSQSKINSLQEQLAKTAVDALNKTDANLIALHGGAKIWIRLTGVCCRSVNCCVSWSRLTWRPVHKWFNCSPRSGSGFNIDNSSTLGTTIWSCLKLVFVQTFLCSD